VHDAYLAYSSSRRSNYNATAHFFYDRIPVQLASKSTTSQGDFIMRFSLGMIIGIFALVGTLFAWAQDSQVQPQIEDPAPSLEAALTFLSDEIPVEECDADADAEACGPAVKCFCSCNGVPVTVTIYPDIHGENCAMVNGRPCNTGAGWFTYKGC
jgi:hypothetical protein